MTTRSKKASRTKPANTSGNREPGHKVDVDAWKRINRLQLAALLGVHPDTISDYVRQGLPCLDSGGRGRESVYDAVDALAWWRERQGKNAKEAAQTRAYEATAKLNELKLARERGELVARDQVILEGQAYTKAWTAKLRALPRELVQSGIVGREAEARVAELLRAVLVEIAGWRTVADARRTRGPRKGRAA